MRLATALNSDGTIDVEKYRLLVGKGPSTAAKFPRLLFADVTEAAKYAHTSAVLIGEYAFSLVAAILQKQEIEDEMRDSRGRVSITPYA
jgi:hypothetical protein